MFIRENAMQENRSSFLCSIFYRKITFVWSNYFFKVLLDEMQFRKKNQLKPISVTIVQFRAPQIFLVKRHTGNLGPKGERHPDISCKVTRALKLAILA